MVSHKLPDLGLVVHNLDRKTNTVTIKVDKSYFSQVSRKLHPYKNLPVQFKPALEKVADYVRTQMIPRTFEREGPGWAPLARRTQIERTIEGYGPEHPILKREGDLYAELTERSHPKHIEIIKTGKNARVEIGGSSQKFVENQVGDARLPARPMIPGTGGLKIAPVDRKNIRDILHRAIKAKAK